MNKFSYAVRNVLLVYVNDAKIIMIKRAEIGNIFFYILQVSIWVGKKWQLFKSAVQIKVAWYMLLLI